MKNKMWFLRIILGFIGLVSFNIEAESRMVCIPEKFTRTGQDQGFLACRYHWATTTLDLSKDKNPYRCYVQFDNEGVKLISMPEFAKIYQKLNPSKQANAKQQLDVKESAEDKSNFDTFLGVLPAQGKLKITKNAAGDEVLTTGKGSPAFIKFSTAYNAAHFAVLNKANYKPAHIRDLRPLFDNYKQLEDRASLVNNLDTILPCLGCVDLDNKCMPTKK